MLSPPSFDRSNPSRQHLQVPTALPSNTSSPRRTPPSLSSPDDPGLFSPPSGRHSASPATPNQPNENYHSFTPLQPYQTPNQEYSSDPTWTGSTQFYAAYTPTKPSGEDGWLQFDSDTPSSNSVALPTQSTDNTPASYVASTQFWTPYSFPFTESHQTPTGQTRFTHPSSSLPGTSASSSALSPLGRHTTPLQPHAHPLDTATPRGQALLTGWPIDPALQNSPTTVCPQDLTTPPRAPRWVMSHTRELPFTHTLGSPVPPTPTHPAPPHPTPTAPRRSDASWAAFMQEFMDPTGPGGLAGPFPLVTANGDVVPAARPGPPPSCWPVRRSNAEMPTAVVPSLVVGIGPGEVAGRVKRVVRG